MSAEVKAKPRKFTKSEISSIDTAAKLNMSLDDIVSLEKTQKKFTKTKPGKAKVKAKAKANVVGGKAKANVVAGKAKSKAKGSQGKGSVRVTAGSAKPKAQVRVKSIDKTRVKRAGVVRPRNAAGAQMIQQGQAPRITNQNGSRPWGSNGQAGGRTWNSGGGGGGSTRSNQNNRRGGSFVRGGGGGGGGGHDGGNQNTRIVTVRNIPYDVTWQDVKDAFQSNGGPIERCTVQNGTAKIIFQSSIDARSAVKTFDGGDMNGRRIAVRLG